MTIPDDMITPDDTAASNELTTSAEVRKEFSDRLKNFWQQLRDDGFIQPIDQNKKDNKTIARELSSFFNDEANVDSWEKRVNGRSAAQFSHLRRWVKYLCEITQSDNQQNRLNDEQIRHALYYLLGGGDDLVLPQGPRGRFDYVQASYRPMPQIQWWENTHSKEKYVLEGIAYFRACVKNDMSHHEAIKQLGRPEKEVALSFRRTLWSQNLRLTHVSRVFDKEEKIRRLCKTEDGKSLQEVFVIHVPKHIDSDVIRTEIVAFEAGQIIFSRDPDEHRKPHPTWRHLAPNGPVGCGGGYTMERLAFHSRLRSTDNAITWLPLHTLADLDGDIVKPMTYSSDPRSPNGICILLRSIHPASDAYRLPFIHSEDRPKSATAPVTGPKTLQSLLRAYWSVKELADTMQHVIISVGDIGYISTHFRYSDGEQPSSIVLQKLYESFTENEQKQIAGEIMGFMVDKDAKPFTSGAIKAKNEQVNLASIEFSRLKTIADDEDKRVWVVAATDMKQEFLHLLIRKGLTNSIVIDEQIADYLLKQATSSSQS